jgi:hypothetical protein
MTKTRSFLYVFMREAFIEQTLNQVALRYIEDNHKSLALFIDLNIPIKTSRKCFMWSIITCNHTLYAFDLKEW